MAQGQSAGVYAQSLREILRKMSRSNAKVQIKVLYYTVLYYTVLYSTILVLYYYSLCV